MEIIDAYWQYSAIHALTRPWRSCNNEPPSREGLNCEMRFLVEDPVGPL